jgi:hypothetical protein
LYQVLDEWVLLAPLLRKQMINLSCSSDALSVHAKEFLLRVTSGAEPLTMECVVYHLVLMAD